MKFKTSPFKIILAGLIIIAIGVGIYFSLPKIASLIRFLISIFLPFILGYLFSVIVNPLADFLQKKLKLPRGISAILVLVLTIGIIGGIITGVIWKIVDEVRNLYSQFPIIYENLQANFTILSEKWSDIYILLPKNVQAACDSFGVTVEDAFANMINVSSSPVVSYAGNIAKQLPKFFISSIVFILSSFFMVSDKKTVSLFTRKLFKKKTIVRAHRLKSQLQKYLGGYVKAQLIIMSIAFVIIFSGLSILKVEYALLIAITIAIFDALPFFGSGGILIPWAIISFLNAEVKTGIFLLVIYLTVLFTRQMIEPKIVSKNIGMHPIVTLMSMYIGYRTLSIGGMILGPVIMMLIISFYKAGLFDWLVKLLNIIKDFIKKEFTSLKIMICNMFGGNNNE